jgi:hypothetical protein
MAEPGLITVGQTCLEATGVEGFPCNVDAITAVSLSIGASLISLIFVCFLTNKVR